jgi:hypothetical protein
MRYLITTLAYKPVLMRDFKYEDHFNDKIGMVVFDLLYKQYTTDGIHWMYMEVDKF